MMSSRIPTPAIVALGSILGAIICSLAVAQDEAAVLVSKLPTNKASLRDAELEKRIAELGAQALPALEKELRLGIRFRTLDQISKSAGSRRWSVVRVLSRIPGEYSTGLLVRSLSDPPDCIQMTVDTLRALSKRTLSSDQVVAMLRNHKPRIVLAGIDHAGESIAVPEINAAVERVFDRDVASAQFHNEYGASTASPEELWAVRLAAGQLLKRDMLPEIRAEAGVVLADLQRETLHPTKPDTPAWPGFAEATICRCIHRLLALGQPVKDLVEGAAKEAGGDHARVLDMALLRLGDRTRLAKVVDHLTAAHSHTVRFCAAVTLRELRDPSTIPALRKALRDPYEREDGSCVRIGDGKIYPVRVVAAAALVAMGEDPKEIRKEMGK